MSIGTMIKRLRRERNMTQEVLAEYLGVSTNAVSQWECDKTAPDISHIPMLAAIFEVSADVLLGIDFSRSKKQAEIAAFVEEYEGLHAKGKQEERLALCREMQKKYPNDETVAYYLMGVLQQGYAQECFAEIVALGERLLTAQCQEYRYGAIRGLCYTYLTVGQRERALEYARMMPVCDDLLVHTLQGEELVVHCQAYFWRLCDKMYLYMNTLLAEVAGGYTADERHAARRALRDAYTLIFPDKDFGVCEDKLGRTCFFMALDSARMGELDRALEELEEMVQHFEEASKRATLCHTSPLVNRMTSDWESVPRHSEESLGAIYLRYLENHAELLRPIADDPRLLALKRRMALV